MLKYRMLYACLLGFTLLLYLFVNDSVTLGIFTGFIILGVVTAVLHRIWARKVSFTLQAVKSTRKGKPAMLVLTGNNQANVPFSRVKAVIEAANTLMEIKTGKILEFSIGVKQRQEVTVELESEYCGRVKVLLPKVVIYDFLGLSSYTFMLDGEVSFLVYPAMDAPMIVEEAGAVSQLDSILYSQEKKGSDVSEVFGLREYQPGDNIKAIHWKLSQKVESGYMIREFAHPVTQGILLLTDISSCFQGEILSNEVKDAIAEQTALLAYSLIRSQPFTMGWYYENSSTLFTIDVTQEDDIIESLASLLSIKVSAEPLGLRQYMSEYYQSPYGKVFYVTSSITKENREALLLMQDAVVAAVKE